MKIFIALVVLLSSSPAFADWYDNLRVDCGAVGEKVRSNGGYYSRHSQIGTEYTESHGLHLTYTWE